MTSFLSTNPSSPSPHGCFQSNLHPARIRAWYLALGLFELHEVCVGPPLKDIQVPLAGIPSPVVPTVLCRIYSSIKIHILEKAPDLILYIIQV